MAVADPLTPGNDPFARINAIQQRWESNLTETYIASASAPA